MPKIFAGLTPSESVKFISFVKLNPDSAVLGYSQGLLLAWLIKNEIDFVIQRNNKIIPIEVKSDKSINHNSLTKYNSKNNNELSFRFSLNNLSKDGKIVNIPLYFIEYIKELNLN